MTPDNQLTILLTLKDRAAFTFRWMAYAERRRFPFRVLIADGSVGDDVQPILADRAHYPHVQYDYVRYSPDRSYADFYAKVVDALSRVQTPYVILVDNDDFLSVGAVREGLAFMSGHAEYAACGGQCAIFWVTPDEPGDAPLYGRTVAWKTHADAVSMDGETARARIGQYSRWNASTNPILYYVQRTDAVAKRFQAVREANFQDIFLHEQLLVYLAAIDGKTHAFPTLYLARQWNSPESSAGTHHDAFGDWLDRMLIPSWSRDFSTLVDVAAAALAERDGIERGEARRTMVDAYRLETAPALLEAVMREPSIHPWGPVLVRLSQRLLSLGAQNAARRLARAVYRRLRWLSVDLIHGTQLLGRTIANADAEIQPIHQFLTHQDGASPGSRR